MTNVDFNSELRELDRLPERHRLRRLERHDLHNGQRLDTIEDKLSVFFGQIRLAAFLGSIAGAAIVTAIVDLVIRHG